MQDFYYHPYFLGNLQKNNWSELDDLKWAGPNQIYNEKMTSFRNILGQGWNSEKGKISEI